MGMATVRAGGAEDAGESARGNERARVEKWLQAAAVDSVVGVGVWGAGRRGLGMVDLLLPPAVKLLPPGFAPLLAERGALLLPGRCRPLPRGCGALLPRSHGALLPPGGCALLPPGCCMLLPPMCCTPLLPGRTLQPPGCCTPLLPGRELSVRGRSEVAVRQPVWVIGADGPAWPAARPRWL